MAGDEAHIRNVEDATDWLLRLRDAPQDEALRAEFERWLAVHPDRRRAWKQARAAWQLLGEVPPETTAHWPHLPAPAPGPAPLRPRRAAPWLGLAALAACLVLVLAPSLERRLRAEHSTAAAAERVVLADGSTVHLAPHSAVDARFTAERRTVTLLGGDAFFEVTANPDRPFTVEAGGLTVTVVGTAFDVRFDGAVLAVEVQRGAVDVRFDGGGPALDARLGPGDRVAVDRVSGRVSRGRLEPDAVALWRDGRLFVADATVTEVVEELRRFHPGWIVVADDALAGRRVTGLFDLHDPDRALRALVEPVGGRVTVVTPLLHVLTGS
ncbi:FecR family protein [Azospirillum sp. ST 5-10]|uniref:FecR family protein n=1 Tax=unclassified Azospirillum TaxID=2630922 RepID=UPI003F49D940